MKLHPKTFALSTTLSMLLGSLFVTTQAFAVAVIDPATEPSSVASPYVVSDTDLSSGTEKAFRPWFENGAWQGDLVQYNISAGGALSTTVDLSTSPPTNSGANWSARLQFAANISNDADYWRIGNRKIITSTTGTNQKSFDWAELTSAQQAAVDSVAAGNGDATSDILDFIRGDTSKQTDATPTAGTLRARYSILGDIVHSNAVYVDAPAASFNFQGYNEFKNRNKAATPTSGQADRTPIVYVGANDGMLHAFNASTGDEVFAYVPSMVFGKLSKLAASPYVRTFYVDGELSSGDIDFDTNAGDAVTDWRTILVGGLGSGGRGLFALDVTHDALSAETASSGNDSKVLWEKTGNAFGYIHGKAQVALLNDSKWYAIQGNGYSSVDDVAKLLLIEANGTVTEIATDAGITGNGLSSPALLDTNGDSKPDYAYAGDTKGNLWRFNLSTKAAALKLFVTGTSQPITTVPDIARHPNGGVIIYFGTGSLLSGPSTTTPDTANTDAQAFYGIWDNATTTTIANDASILNQPLTEKEFTAGTIIRYSTNNTDINWGSHTGWKVPFPTSGERLVGDPQLRAGRLQFVTTSFDASMQPVAWILELNYLNGGTNGKVIFDLDGDDIRDGADTVNRDDDGLGNEIGTGDIPVALKYGSYGIYAQPAIARIDNYADTLLVNGLLMPVPQPCTGSCAGGFIGGHMDVDTDSPNGGTKASRDDSGDGNDGSGPSTGSNTDGHVHEYDKEHGDVYVDWFTVETRRGLASLNTTENNNALTAELNRIGETCNPNDATPDDPCTTTTAGTKLLDGDTTNRAREFFVVLANADLSSGGTITIGNRSWPVQEYQDMITPIVQLLGDRDLSATGLSADRDKMIDDEGKTLIFTIDSIKAAKDPDGNDGTIRIDFSNEAIIEGNLHATQPGCMWGQTDPYDKGTNPLARTSRWASNGIYDAHITNAQETKVEGYRWRNGSLTMQLIDAKNYTLQPATDMARYNYAPFFPVAGTHAKNYTQSRFFNNGDNITVRQENNTSPVIESGMLYEGSVFNHWGYVWALRKNSNGGGGPTVTFRDAPCYGHATYQTNVSIEQQGLTQAEYNVLIDPFDGDATLQSEFAAALKAYEAAIASGDEDAIKTAKDAYKAIISDNDLEDYVKYRTYIRDKVKVETRLDWDKDIAGTGTGSSGAADVQDGSEDDEQLGQNFRTGRRTWIDLTP